MSTAYIKSSEILWVAKILFTMDDVYDYNFNTKFGMYEIQTLTLNKCKIMTT